MKVVLATDARTAGGVGRHMHDLGAGLIRRGITVEFAAPRESQIATVAADLGARFLAFEDGAIRADVWHLHLADTYDRTSLPALLRARRVARRLVVTEHLPRNNASDRTLTSDRRTPGAGIAKTVFKRIQLSLVDSIIAVSEGSRQFQLHRYTLPARRIVTIHNGVDLHHFRPAATSPITPDHDRTVVAVGSLIRQKGHDVLIHAVALAQQDWRVVVAGSGPQRAALETLASHTAPGRVELRGWVDDVAGLIQRATVVCLPSRWESFAYVALEAMAMGIPVVATRVDGVEEFLTHERSGLLVKPDDPMDLATAIDSIVRDQDYARRLADNGRKDAAAFGLDLMVDKTLEHYRSLL
ncbi:glycosyltransferase family 4 protein [Actinoplanes sp. URMC 104]|uniref:glycosyltransferase family 4 protein n=1 Tax=Actinoplanes sp. URMC 104 TaxID=3423409 RepID=UPI003F1CE40C